MNNPYFWNFPQREDTMYMSTIGKTAMSQIDSQVH